MRKLVIFLAIILFISSCARMGGLKKKEFVFYDQNKKHRISLHLPPRIANEYTLVDDLGDREQQFFYEDSSMIYVTVFAKHVINSSKKTLNEGKDSSGKFWKQVQFENFEVGYRFVNPFSRNKFEDAISSLRIK